MGLLKDFEAIPERFRQFTRAAHADFAKSRICIPAGGHFIFVVFLKHPGNEGIRYRPFQKIKNYQNPFRKKKVGSI